MPKVFSRLGGFLRQFSHDPARKDPDLEEWNREHFLSFGRLMENEHIHNPWFTPDNVRRAVGAISAMLDREVLHRWLAPYGLPPVSPEKIRKVGLVMAGNIPLVGFHDMLCVLLAGHSPLVRPSSKDDRLIRKIGTILGDMEPALRERIRFTGDRLGQIDAVIATGSDNSARHFDYYFRHIPRIIRRNRNGVAVLAGNETEEQLAGIGHDIFTYFGMGCRNVTKLYIPGDYDLKVLLGVFDRFAGLARHHKYVNNVDYNRTIYLMNRVPFLDNGVLLLKEDQQISSPVGVVFYERYSEIHRVVRDLETRKEEIQCIVSLHPEVPDAIPPGTTQHPMPWDYADGIDTIHFLEKI